MTQELEANSAALGAKLVVAGSKTFNTSGTDESDTSIKESIYTYYDIGINGGYAFDEPTITIADGKATGNVKLYNYSGEKKEFKVYLAVYNNNELIGLNVTNVDLVAEKDDTFKDFTTPEAAFASGNEVKLFVWKADGITPELVCKDSQ